ncbi:jg10397 [Pararge aegeria aegeria]|uniref:Jg10397 protein n=1 Tax=Pararge aegeria aegeria TaxID=348720 RepID=A0A8S4S6Y0_9NEOP|nr:jg10397 [Pararge aegeria aegeria]
MKNIHVHHANIFPVVGIEPTALDAESRVTAHCAKRLSNVEASWPNISPFETSRISVNNDSTESRFYREEPTRNSAETSSQYQPIISSLQGMGLLVQLEVVKAVVPMLAKFGFHTTFENIM